MAAGEDSGKIPGLAPGAAAQATPGAGASQAAICQTADATQITATANF